MNLSNLISGSIGGVHLLFSIMALICGTYILFGPKGTIIHKRIGYVYSVSMVMVLATAFAIYSLYGSFGIFHWLAVLSSVTLVGGLVPIVLRKPAIYMRLHISFMYWSVIGLYGAFVAESLVRFPDVVVESGIPNSTFYMMTGIGTFIVMMAGNIIFFKKRKGWMEQYSGELNITEAKQVD